MGYEKNYADYIVRQVLARVEVAGEDFTTATLAKLLNSCEDRIRYLAARGKVHGMYRAGRKYLFRKSEILFRRATGQDVFKA